MVSKDDGCWIWKGPTTDDGYGRFHSRVFKKRIRAHAFGYFLENGSLPIPCGCHKCDMPLCVRPDHIFPGTLADNTRDMFAKGRQGDRRVFGVRNAKSKLTPKAVIEIRNRYSSGTTKSQLGREYGITAQSVGAIISGKNWAWLNVTDPRHVSDRMVQQ